MRKQESSASHLSQSEGFLTALWMCMGMKVGGLCHWGTVCSSWVFMSRSSSGRTAGHPWGLALDAGSSSRLGNIMVARMTWGRRSTVNLVTAGKDSQSSPTLGLLVRHPVAFPAFPGLPVLSLCQCVLSHWFLSLVVIVPHLILTDRFAKEDFTCHK